MLVLAQPPRQHALPTIQSSKTHSAPPDEHQRIEYSWRLQVNVVSACDLQSCCNSPITKVPSPFYPVCCIDPPAPCTTFVFCPVFASWFLFGTNGCEHDAYQKASSTSCRATSNQCARRDSVETSTCFFQMSPKPSASSNCASAKTTADAIARAVSSTRFALRSPWAPPVLVDYQLQRFLVCLPPCPSLWIMCSSSPPCSSGIPNVLQLSFF